MRSAHGQTRRLLFLFFFQALEALTSPGNAFRVPAEFEVYFQVEHLADAGDLSVPQTLAAFLALPHHLIGRAIATLCHRSQSWRDRIAMAIAVSAGIALAIGAHIAWDTYRFAKPFDFGYDWAETIRYLPPCALRPGDVPRGLAVLLLSTGKSIVVLAHVESPSPFAASLPRTAQWSSDCALAGVADIGVLADLDDRGRYITRSACA